MELVRVPRSEWSLGRRTKNGAIVVAVRVALLLVRPIPRAVLVVLGRALGWIVWLLATDARRTARRNVDRVHGERTENAKLVRACFTQLGALLGDALVLLRPWHRALETLVFQGDSRRVLEEALSHGRGVVLVTAHLGPWERMASAIVESGFRLTTPVRASYDARLDALVHHPLRRGRGVDAIDRDAPGTPRALLRALRSGGIAGFLVDVATRVSTVRAPFLGHDAPTPSAPARLALRTGAPVVVAIAARGGIVVQRIRDVAAPRKGDLDDEIVALTTRINEVVGAAILREPERWIWMHERWPREAEHA